MATRKQLITQIKRLRHELGFSKLEFLQLRLDATFMNCDTVHLERHLSDLKKATNRDKARAMVQDSVSVPVCIITHEDKGNISTRQSPEGEWYIVIKCPPEFLGQNQRLVEKAKLAEQQIIKSGK